MSIRQDILKLKEIDLWSLVLFTLFKVKDIPEYSSLSELIYLLPKDSLLTLCEYYGGMTITIPTIDELETLLSSLMLYQYVKIDNIEYDKALTMLGYGENLPKDIRIGYQKICEVLSNYAFQPRE